MVFADNPCLQVHVHIVQYTQVSCPSLGTIWKCSLNFTLSFKLNLEERGLSRAQPSVSWGLISLPARSPRPCETVSLWWAEIQNNVLALKLVEVYHSSGKQSFIIKSTQSAFHISTLSKLKKHIFFLKFIAKGLTKLSLVRGLKRNPSLLCNSNNDFLPLFPPFLSFLNFILPWLYCYL